MPRSTCAIAVVIDSTDTTSPSASAISPAVSPVVPPVTAEASARLGWLDAVHPDDRERSRARFQAAVDAGQPLRQEHRIRGTDGTWRWFLVRVRPVRDEPGRIVRWFGAATDIHEQRAALEALRESEGRFRRFAEFSAGALWIVDAETLGLEYLSPAYERIWGEPCDAVWAISGTGPGGCTRTTGRPRWRR